jgi:hypothetical protein
MGGWKEKRSSQTEFASYALFLHPSPPAFLLIRCKLPVIVLLQHIVKRFPEDQRSASASAFGLCQLA